MATTVTFNGVNYSVPAVNEEDWQSLSTYLIALAGAAPAGGSVKWNIRISTSATTAVAVTDYAVLINYAGVATVNLPAGVEGQVFFIGDASGAAATNNITINRNGANTILGGTSVVLDTDGEVIALQFSGGNWYRIGQTYPTSVTGPSSSVDNGVVLFDGTDGNLVKDLGVGTADQVLLTDGTTPAFGSIANANINASAAIALSKLASVSGGQVLLGNGSGVVTGTTISGDVTVSDAGVTAITAGAIVNADVNASAAIAYSKLALTGSIVNADVNGSAAIVYSKLSLSDSIVNADINTAAAIARSKIAAGTADYVVVNDGSGNLSEVAVLPISQGGTGLSALGSALQILRVNAGATGLEFATISGVGDVSGPASSVTNGIVQFASTTGKAIKDLGVGAANQVLLTDGTAPSFGAVTNAYIDASAAIAYSKLALTDSIVNADINASAAIAYSKLAALTSGNILVGSAGNVATSVAMTGDVTISNAGVTAIGSGVIVNADINASAAIAFSKMAALTANRALATDASGFIVATAVTDTELGYVSGVTSGIQSQIDGKTGIADNETITGTWTFNNTISGSIDGNAATVTNGVYTTGTQTIGGDKTFTSGTVIQNGGNTLRLGANLNDSTLTDNTRKYAYVTVPAYNNAEENVLLAQMETDTSFNVIRYGGGDGNYNAVTEHRFYTAANATTLTGTERLRIDSSGNVGIGTGSPSIGGNANYTYLTVSKTTGAVPIAVLELQGNRTSATQSNTYIESFAGSNPITRIQSETGSNSTSGDLILYTRNSGSLVEALRADQSGAVTLGPSTFNAQHIVQGSLNVGNTSTISLASAGVFVGGGVGTDKGYLKATRASSPPIAVNRLTDDGQLVTFYQASTLEGVISVSGTTVTYGGGHLARWSQFEDKSTPSVYRGTVMSSTGVMASWDGEENEQLTCSKISDLAADTTVSGIFQEYDTNDDPESVDFWIAQSGDFIIRVAQGVVVAVGDLLESAGDGTARPQADSIVRSSTIAKVMSSMPSITYPDGSYCIPCLLML